MNRSQQWQDVPALIDQLIETAEVGQRDRILLEAVAGQDWIEAAALWRPGSDGPEFGARWHPVLSRGPADALPDREALHTIVHGERAGDFYPGVRVLQSGEGLGAFALAVACAELSDSEEDLLEALLCLFSALDEGDGADRELEQWIPLLPSDESSRVEHDLRNLLTGIQTTQELLERYGEDLSEDESLHFEALLEEECSRAGDLLGFALSSGPAPEARECRVAELLSELIAEQNTSGDSALHLQLGAGMQSSVCGVDDERLRAPLQRFLRESSAGRTNVQLTLEPGDDATAQLMIQLADFEGDPSSAAPSKRSCDALRRLGVELDEAGGSWTLRFPARRSA